MNGEQSNWVKKMSNTIRLSAKVTGKLYKPPVAKFYPKLVGRRMLISNPAHTDSANCLLSASSSQL